MAKDKRVKDIMVPIAEYNQVDAEAHLCDALAVLKKTSRTTRPAHGANFTKPFL